MRESDAQKKDVDVQKKRKNPDGTKTNTGTRPLIVVTLQETQAIEGRGLTRDQINSTGHIHTVALRSVMAHAMARTDSTLGRKAHTKDGDGIILIKGRVIETMGIVTVTHNRVAVRFVPGLRQDQGTVTNARHMGILLSRVPVRDGTKRMAPLTTTVNVSKRRRLKRMTQTGRGRHSDRTGAL